ncbi:oxysterol-binding protein-related protein 9-like [Bolinopsis microptera]|uniref:oxysterol-binding protein-related protein 9-like n=1 Tax=Bolinopsis microptera TaxID=2820187 RepID=UPI0030799940
MMKGWQLRFFVLDEHTLCLNYYTSKEKVRKDIKRGKIFLKGAIIGIDDTDDSTFTISVEGKTFHFRAADADDRDRWARSLEETIYRPPALNNSENASRHNINDLQRKLAEVNGYLSLLEDTMSGMVQQVSLELDPSDSAQLEICNNAMISSLHDCVGEMNKLEFSAGKPQN